MKINLEILSAAHLLGKKQIENLHTKELVPKMIIRRRLTRAAKIAIELQDMVGFKDGRIINGTNYGELEVTVKILEAIKENQSISPTNFQNSVYNTAVSYLSILSENKHEITTLSCGDKTARSVLKAGAIKALDGDEILLLCFETINIKNIEEVNSYIEYLESGVALKVKATDKKANIQVEKSDIVGVPNSISELLQVAQKAQNMKTPIVEVSI
ncbi:beta-ketoacyl synthase chain length factor [Sulfurospirillum arcachonense]|uniref:beta-ketoacyl synthase chain length factor n=1 Tax=Sulfurospirillum arcachonense TaxID=57666 RepID=UPI000469F329|nr:beta-ketoacyl synthase chain length factor [Sulfurospirillum arcachonense]